MVKVIYVTLSQPNHTISKRKTIITLDFLRARKSNYQILSHIITLPDLYKKMSSMVRKSNYGMIYTVYPYDFLYPDQRH